MVIVPEVGDEIRTQFLRGKVVARVDGARRGWSSEPYYWVEVISPSLYSPALDQPNYHLVRHDEVINDGT